MTSVTPPTDFAALAELLERASLPCLVAVSRECEPIGGGMMAYGGPGAFVNKACGFGTGANPGDVELDRLERFFAARDVVAKVEVSPFVSPQFIHDLAERRFALVSVENRLCLDLSELREVGAPPPGGLRISAIDPRDDEAVQLFGRVAYSGFVPEGEAMSDVLREYAFTATRAPGMESYLAWMGDEAVAGACFTSHGGVATLLGASVLPPWRRRGIQRALLLARLRRARELGCRWASVASKPGIATESNAAKLGFRIAYTRMVMEKRA